MVLSDDFCKMLQLNKIHSTVLNPPKYVCVFYRSVFIYVSLSVDGVGVRGDVCSPVLEVEGRGVSISSSYVSVASSGTVVAAMHIKKNLDH